MNLRMWTSLPLPQRCRKPGNERGSKRISLSWRQRVKLTPLLCMPNALHLSVCPWAQTHSLMHQARQKSLVFFKVGSVLFLSCFLSICFHQWTGCSDHSFFFYQWKVQAVLNLERERFKRVAGIMYFNKINVVSTFDAVKNKLLK